jgi:hypothetical protein
MVCHSIEFTLAILREKPYFGRLSSYFIEQTLSLDCNDFSRLLRAIDAAESGVPDTKWPGDFVSAGLLSGYGHFHYRTSDWAATNLAVALKMPVRQSLDETIDATAEKIIAGGGDPRTGIEVAIGKFIKRIRKASGDWVIYRDEPLGRRYLAIHEHTERRSAEEHQLKALLDSIVLDGGDA